MKITEYPSVTNLSDSDLLLVDGEGGPRTIRVADLKTELALPFDLAIDENGVYGYKKMGADTVTPFNKVSGLFEVDTPGVYNVKSYESAIVRTRNPIVTVSVGEELNIDPVSYHYVHTYYDSSIGKNVTEEKDMYCFLTKQKYDLLFLHIADTIPLYTNPEDIHFDEEYDNYIIDIHSSIIENGVYKGPGDAGGYSIGIPEFTTINGYGHIKTTVFENVPENSSILFMSSALTPCSKATLALSFGVTYE